MGTSRRKKFILKRRKKRRRILISALLLIVVFSIGFIFLNKQNNHKLSSNKLTNSNKNVDENLNKNNKTDDDSDNTSINDNKDSSSKNDNENLSSKKPPIENNPVDDSIKEQNPKEVLISSAGDCTIGADISRTTWNTFFSIFDKQDKNYSYFFKNVFPYFSEDDYTTVNLETTFTNSTDKFPNKAFNFKAPPDYVKILTEGSIEGVTIANNHAADYKKQGLKDTITTLEGAKIDYFGTNYKYGGNYKVIKKINGHNFGFLGYTVWDSNLKETMKKDIEELNAQNCTVIINIHWGKEGSNYPNSTQKDIAHFAIDNGADMILGHHPHVIQGIEQYKGRFIAYSLGNFCFGGHNNPKDKDTFILQQKYTFDENSQLSIAIKVIPCTVSSVKNLNDYCPTPITSEEEKERFFNKLNKISPNSGYTINNDFYTAVEN